MKKRNFYSIALVAFTFAFLAPAIESLAYRILDTITWECRGNGGNCLPTICVGPGCPPNQ